MRNLAYFHNLVTIIDFSAYINKILHNAIALMDFDLLP